MEIYLDVIIIENFIVDMFLLAITFRILKVKVNSKRLCVSGIIGSIYTIVMVFPKLKIFSMIPIQLIIAFLMIEVSLRGRKIMMKIKGTGIYLLCAITLSGMCFLSSLWQNSYTITSNFTINKFSLKYLILALMILFLVYDRVHAYLRERVVVISFTYDIELSIGKVKYIIRGFLDTGNELREPITNLPCIIIEESFLSNYSAKENEIYYIPYSAIGYAGKLSGFRGDKVRIRRKGEEWREVDAIICPCKEVLSRDREFNALLSRGVI